MTNEELVARLMQGDEPALEELCRNNKGLIYSCARKIAGQYHCIRYGTEGTSWSSYTTTIIDDLCSEGMVAFIECIRSGRYDREHMLTTFVMPYIAGAMRRYMESSLGNLALSRKDMSLTRKVQSMYHAKHKAVSEISVALGISEKAVERYLGHNTHFYGIADAIQSAYEDGTSDPIALMEDRSAVSPALLIYLDFRRKYMEELFNTLPRKDRDILGEFYGVFGYEKKPLEDIGKYHMIKPDAVEKAKKKALKKLQKNFSESRLRWWIRLNRQLNYPTPPTPDEVIQTWYPSDEWLIPKRFQRYVCLLAEVYEIFHDTISDDGKNGSSPEL